MIAESDLRIDVYRNSLSGFSAHYTTLRITHIPSGIVMQKTPTEKNEPLIILKAEMLEELEWLLTLDL